MRKYIIAFLSILLLVSIFIIPITATATDMLLIYDRYEGGSTLATTRTEGGMTWRASSDYVMTGIYVRWQWYGIHYNPTETYTMVLYSWDGNNWPASKTLVQTVRTGFTDYDFTEYTNMSWSNLYWSYFELPTPQAITYQSYYAWVIYPDSEGYESRWVMPDSSGNPYSNGQFVTRTGTTPSLDMPFRIQGYHYFTPTVITLDAVSLENNSWRIGGLCTSSGEFTGITGVLEWGTDTYYGTREFIKVVASGDSFFKTFNNVPAGLTIHYRAGLVDRTVVGPPPENTYIWGTDKTFTTSSSGTTGNLLLKLTRNNVEGQSFEIELSQLGVITEGDISIDYDTTSDGCKTSPSNHLVQADVTAPIVLTESGITFTAGTKYFARAKFTDSVNTYYSPIISFLAFDSSKPTPVNWIENLFGGPMVWWWIAFLMVGISLVAGAVLHKSWIVLIGFVICCGFLVIVNSANIWLVALMALLVGLGMAGYLIGVRR